MRITSLFALFWLLLLVGANQNVNAAHDFSFTATPASITSGSSATLTWSSTDASSCAASGAWSGRRSTANAYTVRPTATSTYTITCTGTGGSAAQSVTITVSSSPPTNSITSVQLINTSASALAGGVSTFGHAFKQGDVPQGSTVIAKDSAGNPITLQVDKKATHPDGSLRHAILTAKLATLGASATQAITLFAQADSTAQTPVSLANLLATTFDSQVSLNVGGTVYSASAKDLLQNTTPLPWLIGPEVSEWIVGGPVKTVGGAAHPHLAAYFHVRAYAGSPITKVRVDAVVENNWTAITAPSDFSYLPTVTVGNATIYNNGGANLTHYHHSRWHQVGWWNNTDPKIYAKLDVNYLQDTKAVPKYETLTPTEAFLSSVVQSVAPMDNGDHSVNMSDTGAAPGIGPLPRWDAVYAISGDRRAFNYMKANADGGAVYGAHFRDENTGYPVTIDSYPNSSLWDPAGSNPVIPAGTGTNPFVHDGGHQPSIGYTAYLVTGDYYYLEEMQFWSAWNLIAPGSEARDGSPAYKAAASTNGATGLWYTGSLRGQAWAYRSLGQAASITPDAHPLKNYFTTKLINNINYDKWQYVTPGSSKTLFGTMYMAEGNDQFRTWMDDFFTWAIGNLVDLGFSQAKPLLDYKVKFPLGRMGEDTTRGFCFQFGASYTHPMGPSRTTLYGTWAEVYAATTSATATCGTQAMADWLTATTRISNPNYNHTFVINEMTGYQDTVAGYYENMRPALAMAVQSGVAGGAEAWVKFNLSGVKPIHNDYPNWAIVPRAPY